jgi:hypothetical protein
MSAAVSKPSKHISDGNSHVADARPAATLARLDRDDLLVIHGANLASFRRWRCSILRASNGPRLPDPECWREDRFNAGLTVIVLKTADQKSKLMRVVAPLGVLLPSGLGLKLDNVDVGRAGFVRCLPNGCVAEVVMDDKLLGQLRTAKTATFIIFETPEEGIGFPLSLNGIGEGYDKLP